MATKTVIESLAFRLVVRGTNEDGIRIRRCKVQHADSYEGAWEAFASHYLRMVKGLSDPSYSVLPPVRLRINGTASIGYALDD